MSPPLELREGDFAAFFEAPFRAYGADSLYVSPARSDLLRFLDERKNPLFARFGARRFYTVHEGGAPIGRIVAHVHRTSNERHGLRRSFFGYFDCADDREAAQRLLAAAEEFGRAQGCEEIAGNFNLTAMQQCGVVTDGFESQPYTDQMYNPPHVPALLEACGYERFFPMRTIEVDLARLDPETLLGPRIGVALAQPVDALGDVARAGSAGSARSLPRAPRRLRPEPNVRPLTDESSCSGTHSVDPRSRISAVHGPTAGRRGRVRPHTNPLLHEARASPGRRRSPYLRSACGARAR
jgi:hypothetical protein